MSFTEPLLYATIPQASRSPRHPAGTTPTSKNPIPATPTDMVAVAHDDDDGAVGALVAADGRDDDDDVPAVRSVHEAWALFLEESRRLWAIGAPIAFNVICLYGTNSTTQIFAGHVGNRELSAVAIGLSVVSNFSFGFLLGMGSALETLCGQAFGAGQVSMLGVYMQRSWIILTSSAVLLTPLYVFAEPLLRLLGQDPDIAAAAWSFTRGIIPQMFALAITFPTQKFLQAQSKVAALAWIGLAALLAHVGLLALFVSALGWGAAAAYDVSARLTSLAHGSHNACVSCQSQEENYGHRFRAWPAAGYFLVAAPATAILAGLVQGPAMIFFAYAILLLGVAVIVRAVLPLPPRPAERVEERAVQNDDKENAAAFLAWCGYVLVAAPVAAGWLGLAGEPVPAFLAYVLLLLGVGFVGAGLVAPDKLKTA